MSGEGNNTNNTPAMEQILAMFNSLKADLSNNNDNINSLKADMNNNNNARRQMFIQLSSSKVIIYYHQFPAKTNAKPLSIPRHKAICYTECDTSQQ